MKKIPLIFFFAFLFCECRMAHAQRPNITVTKFRDSALASQWCPYDTTLVAYNLLRPDGFYDIYTARVGPGNSFVSEQCFTCLNASLPGKNYAQPTFSPSGKYMLFTAEKAHHAGSSNTSIPGVGTYNDLWLMKMDGSKAWQLCNMPDTGISAIIEPWFNPKGNEIMWCQMTNNVSLSNGKQYFGYWVIKIAPFIDDTVNGPHIDSANIRTIEPGGSPAFNEPYGWSRDGSRIIFASDYNQFWVWDDQIYTSDTMGNNIEQMTSTAHSYPYTEHAFYSADGKHIVWMTDLDIKQGGSKGGDDWFIMNSDTIDQIRLTYFNDTTSSYWTGTVHVNCHGSFCSDNRRFIGDVTGSEPVQVNPDSSIGAAYIISSGYFTGIENISQNALQFNLYPNPNNGQFTIQMENVGLTMDNWKTQIDIYNILGEKVYSSTLPQTTKGTLNIDLGEVPSGVYFLQLFNETTSASKKFVVEK